MPEALDPVQLHRIAHSRTGDKGSTANISVIAYHPELYQVLLVQVTIDRVLELFRDREPTAIHRYELPKLGALNFVLEEVLDGGVNEALGLDTHGKTLSFLMLSMQIAVPNELMHLAK